MFLYVGRRSDCRVLGGDLGWSDTAVCVEGMGAAIVSHCLSLFRPVQVQWMMWKRRVYGRIFPRSR